FYILFIFFFSSRRRHTRSDRDWSSDVCSSDLPLNQTRTHNRQRPRRNVPALKSTSSELRVSVIERGFMSVLMRHSVTGCDSKIGDRKSTRLNSSHDQISYAVFCLKKKKKINIK